MNYSSHLIIIPVYKAPRLIDKCLKYLVKNTDLKRNKVVIIDDASKDKTISILKKYEEKYPEISLYYNKKNQSKPKNVNRILKKYPRMDYYTVLDQDVFIYTKNWPKLLFKAHKIFGDRTILGGLTYEKGFLFKKGGITFLDPYPFWTLAGRFFSFSKKIFKKLGYFYDKSYRHEDREYCFRAYLAGFKWYYIKDIKAKTFVHPLTKRRRKELARGVRENKTIQKERNNYLMLTHKIYYKGRNEKL